MGSFTPPLCFKAYRRVICFTRVVLCGYGVVFSLGDYMSAKVDSLVEFWGDKYLPFSPVSVKHVSSGLSKGTLGLDTQLSDLTSSSVSEGLSSRYLVWRFTLEGLCSFYFILKNAGTLGVSVTDMESFDYLFIGDVPFRPSEDDIYLKKHIASILLRYVSFEDIVSYFNTLPLFNAGFYRSTKDYMFNLTDDAIYGGGSLESVCLGILAKAQGRDSLGGVVACSADLGYTSSFDFYRLVASRADWFIIRFHESILPDFSEDALSSGSGDSYGILVGMLRGSYYNLSLVSQGMGTGSGLPLLTNYGSCSYDIKSDSSLDLHLDDVLSNFISVWSSLPNLLDFAYVL